MSSPGYAVKTETVSGCGADLFICSLLDRQQYSDPGDVAELAGVPPASWPIFGQLWPSARVLAQRMASWVLNGQRILEVGCGLGLASLVLHRRAGLVTASDCHPLVPEFLLKNLALNHLGAMAYQTAHWGRANALGRFDLIIGSDVLYEPGHAELLSAFVDAHAETDGKVLLVDANRSQHSRFSKHMLARGFGRHTELVAHAPGLDAPYRGRVLSYQR